MAKKVVKKTTKKSVKKPVASVSRAKSFEYQQFVVPGILGGAITWIITSSFSLGLIVFIAVILGSWVAQAVRSK